MPREAHQAHAAAVRCARLRVARRATVVALLTATIGTSSACAGCSLEAATKTRDAAPKARIVGRVVDTFGVPVAGVAAEIVGSGFRAVTDADGRFSLTYAPGRFVVRVSSQGILDAARELEVAQPVPYPLGEIETVRFPGQAEAAAYTGERGETVVPLLRRPIGRAPVSLGTRPYGLMGSPAPIVMYPERLALEGLPTVRGPTIFVAVGAAARRGDPILVRMTGSDLQARCALAPSVRVYGSRDVVCPEGAYVRPYLAPQQSFTHPTSRETVVRSSAPTHGNYCLFYGTRSRSVPAAAWERGGVLHADAIMNVASFAHCFRFERENASD